MKLGLIIIGLVAIAWIGIYYSLGPYPIASTTEVAAITPQSPDTAKEEVEGAEDIKELEFTEEQLKDYYVVYENPFVIAIRSSLNNYLAGKTADGEGVAETAIEKEIGEDGTIRGLDSFNKNYYRSKYIVFARNPSTWGGEVINVVFVDKPDKLFNVWMYQRPDGFEMRGFWQNKSYDEAEMAKLNKQYKWFLSDKQHAL